MYWRHGDVLIKKVRAVKGKKLNHLVLAEGEVSGHKHVISEGEAELYEENGILYLHVESEKAFLTHEEHKTLELPKGDFEITIQREYVVGEEKYRSVAD